MHVLTHMRVLACVLCVCILGMLEGRRKSSWNETTRGSTSLTRGEGPLRLGASGGQEVMGTCKPPTQPHPCRPALWSKPHLLPFAKGSVQFSEAH